MAKVTLNKNALNGEKQKLNTYSRFLPALEMKRKQLLREQKATQQQIDEQRAEVAHCTDQVRRQLPMLAAGGVDIEGLVTLRDYQLGTENLVGVAVPVLQSLTIDTLDYGLFATPHWLDDWVVLWRRRLEAELNTRVLRQRKAIIDKALLSTTQRINLFAKVLIPEAKANIRRIQIWLDDNERAAVIRSKLAKARRAGAAAG